MKRQVCAIVVPVLMVALASSAAASIIDADVLISGGTTTYTYNLTSEESGDLITWFHVYAPVPPNLVSGYSVTEGWSFGTGIDEETGEADIFWYVNDQANGGLADGETLTVVMTTSSSIPTLYGHKLPGCEGNWGYETHMWAGYGAIILPPPVAVPSYVPEPGAAVGLLAGLLGSLGYFGLRHRR